jgi:choline dehydrogenase-like flavoprotein
MIVQGFEIDRARALRTHTVVVGSGPGGGVAAYHIAAAGFDTIVVEEGGYHVAREFNQREEDMQPMLYRNGCQQTTSDGLVNVMQGSCYGGGSVINDSDCVPIPGVVLAHWQKLVGTKEITEAGLEDSYKRVRDHLNVRRNNRSLVNRNNLLLMEAAQKLGWKAEVLESNRKGCVGSGYCNVGCSYDARLGTNLTYLPWAIDKGASVYSDLRCDRLERLGGSRYRVHCTVVERGTRRARLPLTIDCERVVLAASTIHTPAILQRSGFGSGLPQLGRNLTLQPQLGVMAIFDEQREIVHWRGAPQSIAVHEFDDNSAEHGLGGFRFEGIGGGVIGFVETFLPGFGLEHKRWSAQMRRTSVSLILVPDRPSGEVTYQWAEDGRVLPKIDYVLQEEWKQRLHAGMQKLGQLLLEAGARAVIFGNQAMPVVKSTDELSKVEQFPLAPGLVTLISAHNQGTCRMGLTPETSVVDQDLKVHGLDNVYVMDASVMPTSASTHIMMPIMVMADRAVHRMLAK